MRIGFFGDSFVYELSNPHSWYYKYVTYLKLIQDHYKAEVVNLGVGGSSYWDAIIKQFPPHENNLPDVCVFCWTDFSRLYHPNVRNLGSWLLNKRDWKDTHYKHLLNYKEYRATREYFTRLYDHEKSQRESIAAFYHFDREVLSKIQNKTKIIHLWSFGVANKWDQENPYYPSNINYIYHWQIQYPEYKFVQCDLLGESNLLDYIDTSIPDTFFNLSNIFNYEGTVFFYSLAYRKYKETELVGKIKSMLPSATINFSLQSNLFDIVPTWHL